MKQNGIKFMLAVLMSMVANVASAYDFEVDSIYYTIISSENLTVQVDGSYAYDVNIPETVTYRNRSFHVTKIYMSIILRNI